MIMADVFKILFPLLGTLAALVCFWLLFEALFPQTVSRERERYERIPIKAFFLGLLITLPVFLIGSGMAKAPNPGVKLLGVTLLVLLLTAALVGLAGLARHIGCRLSSNVDVTQPWRRVFRGGLVLAISFLMPIAGWLVILPVSLISGVGVLSLSLGKARSAASPVAEA